MRLGSRICSNCLWTGEFSCDRSPAVVVVHNNLMEISLEPWRLCAFAVQNIFILIYVTKAKFYDSKTNKQKRLHWHSVLLTPPLKDWCIRLWKNDRARNCSEAIRQKKNLCRHRSLTSPFSMSREPSSQHRQAERNFVVFPSENATTKKLERWKKRRRKLKKYYTHEREREATRCLMQRSTARKSTNWKSTGGGKIYFSILIELTAKLGFAMKLFSTLFAGDFCESNVKRFRRLVGWRFAWFENIKFSISHQHWHRWCKW